MAGGAERGGSPAVEAALIAVVIGLLIAFAIAGGRLVSAEAAVEHSARSAARVASLQRTIAAAETAARQAAVVGLAEQGLRCTRTDVAVDVSGLRARLGTPATVTVTVHCTVDWADLGLPGAPGTTPVESIFSSPIDRWRERP